MIRKLKLSPSRVIALGFVLIILAGSILLKLPISQNEGVHLRYIDALFTSTSAVCVTGLVTVDTAETYTVFGRIVIMLLIQFGGLGFSSIGFGIMMLAGRRISMRSRLLAREAMNYPSFQGIFKLLRSVLLITLCFELAGAVVSTIVFAADYPFWTSVGMGIFHSISAFNNAGFDLMGGMVNLIPYSTNVLMNITTACLIIFGGLGFYVTRELCIKHRWRGLSLHSKIVLTMTAFLIIAGTLALKASEPSLSWLGAFFISVSTRTAGFTTYALNDLTNLSIVIMIILMFIGASPGSTGGGIKTVTLFLAFRILIASATNREPTAFHRSFPHQLAMRSLVIILMALSVVLAATSLICIFDPAFALRDILFESVSAFGTVGLSTGITPALSDASKFTLVLTMFIGRIGPLTVASLWIFKNIPRVSYAEEIVAIG